MTRVASGRYYLQLLSIMFGQCHNLTCRGDHRHCDNKKSLEHYSVSRPALAALGVIAVAQGFCEASSQSSSDQQASCFALASAAVHWSCITAHLYGEQISIGVIAVAQGFCEASLQSSTEQ